MRLPALMRTVSCRVSLVVFIVGLGPGLAYAGKQPFVWSQDAYWSELETRYGELRAGGCQDAGLNFVAHLHEADALLQRIAHLRLAPDAPEFAELERRLFELGPIVGACKTGLPEYIHLVTDIRSVVKQQSEHWDMTTDTARITLYRLLYGGRGALEEIMAQVPADTVPALTMGTNEPSVTPSVEIKGVRVHSGDILVSRGGAATSALIARGNDYPGNFSHIAFVYVDAADHKALIVESHIEVGVVVSAVEEYFADKKLRVMLLRLRADLPFMQQDPMLPHQAASFAYKGATDGHIPYDFAMDYKDHSRLFCSEVASAAYEQVGIHLWARMSHMSSPGLQRWLKGFGVRHFETQEPSDLEYDPQLRVVAEWRDPVTLRQDRMDNAVTDVMLEGAEAGDDLSSQGYLMPVVGLVKGYSRLLNVFGKPGPVPEGMPASAALYSYSYDSMHKMLKGKLVVMVGRFREEYGYEPPYWTLVRLAREVRQEI
jgi:hypothetical protein